jgi:tetratricopeptide (TPR) repeat protein
MFPASKPVTARRVEEGLPRIQWGRPLPEGVGQPAIIRRLLETALAAEPARAALHVKLAHVHLDQLDYRGAAKCLEQAIALEPADAHARLLLARCYNMLGRSRDALHAAAPVEGPQYERAAALAELGDPAAEQEFRRVLEVDPNHLSACRLLCRQLRRSGRHEELLGLCEELFARGGGSAQLLYNWGVALALTGDHERARRLMFDPMHIARMRLPVPDGFADIAAFNAALAEEILGSSNQISEFPEEVEANRGSRRVDNLFVGRRPELIGVLVHSLQQMADAYRPGQRGGFDPWPQLRPAQARLRPWGLLQRNEAYEAGHIHPLAWLSGVYYVRVPRGVSALGEGPGCLAFGPPAVLGTNRPPATRYRPREGMLLFAPSHYEHWTIPSGLDEERISIAFDVIPEKSGHMVGISTRR